MANQSLSSKRNKLVYKVLKLVHRTAKRKRGLALTLMLFLVIIFVALVGLIAYEVGDRRRAVIKQSGPAEEDNVTFLVAPLEEEQEIQH